MGTSWVPVTVGRSAAEVRRSADGSAYAKSVRGTHDVELLRGERDRVVWLATTGIPGAAVLDWVENGDRATLVTSTVPGVPACDVAPTAVRDALRAVGDLLAALHSLPAEDCPFDRRLAVTVPAARVAVVRGRVDEADFDSARVGRSAPDLLDDLEAALPPVAAAEPADLVVCHGDACLPNVVVDPEGSRATGLVDLGRLGVADRHLDLALVARSVACSRSNPQYREDDLPALWAAYGAEPADGGRMAFYRLLDEFF